MTNATSLPSDEEQYAELMRQTKLLYEAFDDQLKQDKNLGPLFNIIFDKLCFSGMAGTWPLTVTNFKRSNYGSHEAAQRAFADSLITYLVHGSNSRPGWALSFPSEELLAKRQFRFDEALGIFLKEVQAEYAERQSQNSIPQSALPYPFKSYNFLDGSFAPDEPPLPDPQDRDGSPKPKPRTGGAEAELVTEEAAPAPAVAGLESGKRVGVISEAPAPPTRGSKKS
jgi:hypothetical protein